MENTEQNASNRPLEADVLDTDKYHKEGLECAETTQANPNVIATGLQQVLNLFREDSQTMTVRRIQKLESDIDLLKNQKASGDIALNNERLRVEAKKDEIEDLKQQRNDVKGKTDGSEFINIVLIIFGLLTSFLFLYVFYASVGYSVLYEIKGTNFLDANVFVQAAKKGGSALAIVYLIPAVVLAFGLLIHVFFSAIEKEKERGKKIKNWALLIGVLLGAFCLDTIFGYKISENVHNAKLAEGLIDKLWQPTFVFTDTDFYLVLMLGFVTYLVWGLLLHKLITSPLFNIKHQIKLLNEKIKEAKDDLLKLEMQLNEKVGVLNKLVEEITKKQQDVHNYKNGGVYYDIQKFKGAVAAFMEGYSSYVTNVSYFNNKDKADEITNLAKQKQIEWENEHIQTLSREN